MRTGRMMLRRPGGGWWLPGLAVVLLSLHGCAEERTTAPGALGPAGLLPGSLHGTAAGLQQGYSADHNGMEAVAHLPYSQLDCGTCHVGSNDCTRCHQTAGDKPPDQNCLVCHYRQQAEINSGLGDVHRDLSNARFPNGMACADCHGADDAHGDGTSYSSMFEAGAIHVKCESCHPLDTLPANGFHFQHAAQFECSACHVQAVVTCYNCHFGSEAAGQGQVSFDQFHDQKFLVRNATTNRVTSANVETIVYDGQAQVSLAPYYAHTIQTHAIRTCGDCHSSPAMQQYNSTGSIQVVRWDEPSRKLVPLEGIIPVPADWRTALKFDFATIDSVASTPTTRAWKQLVPDSVSHQAWFAEPLSKLPPR